MLVERNYVADPRTPRSKGDPIRYLYFQISRRSIGPVPPTQRLFRIFARTSINKRPFRYSFAHFKLNGTPHFRYQHTIFSLARFTQIPFFISAKCADGFLERGDFTLKRQRRTKRTRFRSEEFLMKTKTELDYERSRWVAVDYASVWERTAESIMMRSL